MIRRLFVYGTLEPSRAPAGIQSAVSTFRLIDNATVRGALYGLNGYPGLLLRPRGQPIAGRVFEIPAKPEQVFTKLDRYERFDPRSPAASLFRRVRCRPLLQTGCRTAAWVYVYNRPVDERHRIVTGRWIAPGKKP